MIQIESPIIVTPEIAQMYRSLAKLVPPEGAAGYADLARRILEWLKLAARSSPVGFASRAAIPPESVAPDRDAD